MVGSFAPNEGAGYVGLTVHSDLIHVMKQRLVDEQASLQGELVRLEAIISAEESLSEHAGLGNHMADDASDMFERQKMLSLQQNTERILTQVEGALRRIKSGTYGICEQCGGEIDRARLEALPRCALCMTCKSRREKA